MYCPNCGTQVQDGCTFCRNCGANLSAPSSVPAQPVNVIPMEYKPLSPWAYVGWNFLFALPVVGFILLIIFSFNDSNINRRNYARSFWCALLIVIAFFVIISIIAVSTGTADELVEILEEYPGIS